jgi:hypothetical protein
MELVGILHVLRRHRPLVAVGGLAALLIGLAIAYQLSLFPPNLASRQRASGVTAARVLIVTSSAPAFDVEADAAGTLGTRALLLGDLLSSDVARAAIARGAGVRSDEIAVITPSMASSPLQVPLAVKATEASRLTSEPYVLTVRATGDIPIIALKANAPDAAGAVRIVNAATASLNDLIASRSTTKPRLLVERLGVPVGRTVVTGSSKAVAFAAVLLTFLLWCSAIVIVAGVARRSRGRRSPAWRRRPRVAS